VVVTARGDVVVLDSGLSQVRVYGQDGALRRRFGSRGSGSRQFRSPEGLAVDAYGNIYVADTGNSRIMKFSAYGVPRFAKGKRGSRAGQYRSPKGIAVDSKGNIYVADTGNNRVQKLKSDGTYVWTLSSRTSRHANFRAPADVAVDRTNRLYVSDTGNHRIVRFTQSGQRVSFKDVIGGEGVGDGQLRSPKAVRLDGAGNLYVGDVGNGRVSRFNSFGLSTGTFAGTLSGGVAFSSPQCAAVDRRANFVIVADAGDSRVRRLDMPRFEPDDDVPGSTVATGWPIRGVIEGPLDPVDVWAVRVPKNTKVSVTYEGYTARMGVLPRGASTLLNVTPDLTWWGTTLVLPFDSRNDATHHLFVRPWNPVGQGMVLPYAINAQVQRATRVTMTSPKSRGRVRVYPETTLVEGTARRADGKPGPASVVIHLASTERSWSETATVTSGRFRKRIRISENTRVKVQVPESAGYLASRMSPTVLVRVEPFLGVPTIHGGTRKWNSRFRAYDHWVKRGRYITIRGVTRPPRAEDSRIYAKFENDSSGAQFFRRARIVSTTDSESVWEVRVQMNTFGTWIVAASRPADRYYAGKNSNYTRSAIRVH
jgi:sugar lactone lactonase YvrE